MEAIVLVVQRL